MDPSVLRLRPEVCAVYGDGATELVDGLTQACFVVDGPLDGDPRLRAELSHLGLWDEGLPIAAIRDRQMTARVRALLDFATTTVPLYRSQAERYDGGAIRGLDDLGALPLLTKADLRAHFPGGLIAEGVDLSDGMARGDLGFAATSGTGGDRTQTLVDLRFGALPDGYAGLFGCPSRDGEPRLAMFTTPLCMGSVCHLGGSRYEDRLVGDTALFLPSSDDIFALGDQQVREILGDWERFQPEILFANSVYLHWLARRAQALGLPLPPVDVIVTSYQFLSRIQRRALQEIFGVPVFDSYGATDAGRLALECREGRLHAREDCTLLEVVDARGRPVEDQVGSIAVTMVENRVAPLLRYLVGDLGRLLPDGCTCPFRAWRCLEVHGRRKDALGTSRGPRTTRRIDEALGEVPGIDFYQCSQRAVDQVALSVRPRPGEGWDRAAAKARLHELGFAEVTLREVGRFDLEGSRKFAHTRTTLPPPAVFP